MRDDLKAAIENRGLVIDYQSFVHRMLERTGKDVGSDRKIYADAQIYQDVAIQFYEGRVPIHTQVPGGSRIATPWLAAKLRPVEALRSE